MGAGTVDEETPGVVTEGCVGWGLVDTARLLVSVLFVIGPNLGSTLFSLAAPFIPVVSTRLVTSDGNGICLLSCENCKKSLITHHMTKE